MPLRTYHCSRELRVGKSEHLILWEISLLVPDVEGDFFKLYLNLIFLKRMDLTVEINKIYRQK